jgi:cytochrome b involved in lipid metabolism
VLLEEAGRDATEAFEDVGHSDEARDILKGLQIGVLSQSDVVSARGGTGAVGSRVAGQP